MAIPYLDTLIANISSCFSGEVIELVVSASLFHLALKRAVFQEKKVMMEKKHQPSIFARHRDTWKHVMLVIFPETFKMMNIFLALPIGTASVEPSFSHLKMIKTRLRSCLSDCSGAQLMRVSIEGAEIDAVEFEEILELCKT